MVGGLEGSNRGYFPCLCRTAGSTKYFGTAKARYDFCARDRSELSLKEGDIIKILNKKGQQGWWRGEIYGRVSRGALGSHSWAVPDGGLERVGRGASLVGKEGGTEISCMHLACIY